MNIHELVRYISEITIVINWSYVHQLSYFGGTTLYPLVNYQFAMENQFNYFYGPFFKIAIGHKLPEV